jgi:hypothetical protein
MGFFDMIGNAVGNRVGSKIEDFQSIPETIGGIPGAVGGKVTQYTDFMKALTQDPESFEDFLMENPDFMQEQSARASPSLPALPGPPPFRPGGFVNQNPNFLNSAQQVLTGGY